MTSLGEGSTQQLMEKFSLILDEKLETKIGDLETKVGDLETKVGDLETQLKTTNTKIDNLETKMDKLETSFEITQMKVNALSAVARRATPSYVEEYDFGSLSPSSDGCDSTKLVMKKGFF